jgi:hypothetical protein
MLLVTEHAVKDTDGLLRGGLRQAVRTRGQEQECLLIHVHLWQMESWYQIGNRSVPKDYNSSMPWQVLMHLHTNFTAASIDWRQTSISVG